jgi:hypothetical protein
MLGKQALKGPVLNGYVEIARMIQGDKELVLLRKADYFFVGSRYKEEGETVAEVFPCPSLKAARRTFGQAILDLAGEIETTYAPDIFRSSLTVEQAMEDIDRQLEETGRAKCFCGSILSKVVKKFDSSMAMSLIWMVNVSVRWEDTHIKEIRWVNVPKEAPKKIIKSRVYPHLARWNLAEPQTTEAGTAKKGIWRPTKLGANMVRFPTQKWIPSHVIIKNGEVQGTEEDFKKISLKDAAGEHFDLEEMLAGGGYGRIEPS